MKEQIESFSFNAEKSIIEIVKRVKSNTQYLTHPPTPKPDKVWKEVYGVQENRLVLLETIEGKHIPEHTVREVFKFDDL